MEDNLKLYQDIANRTDGDIYVGVGGPVRTGKSTFIKNFMDLLVIPNINNEYKRERARDELPQSAAGKTIMTTEPKFIPNEAVEITVGDNLKLKTRLVDCVGYLVNNAIGYLEDDMPRMVKTPWFEDEIPFEQAAEIGTKKVIQEHSTIGIVMTTDGSIGDIPRNEYVSAEEQVVEELKSIGKPFIVILNSVHPMLPETENLANKLKESYGVPVLPISVENMNEKEMYTILKEALFEFPIEGVKINIPEWIAILNHEHYLKKEYISRIKNSVIEINKLRDIDSITNGFKDCEYIDKSYISNVDTSLGEVTLQLDVPDGLYSKILNDIIGTDISSKANLLAMFQ